MCAQKSVTVIAPFGQVFSHFLHPIHPSSQAVVTAFAFGMGAAAYESLLLVWCKLDQMMRTFCNTLTTGFTCITVYDCNTVHDMDRIKRTGFYAASESHTSIGTGFGTAARDECHHFTVFYTCVSVVVFCFFTSSGTFYESSHTCALD